MNKFPSPTFAMIWRKGRLWISKFIDYILSKEKKKNIRSYQIFIKLFKKLNKPFEIDILLYKEISET